MDLNGFKMSTIIHRILTEKIIKIYFEVYNALGYRFLEKIYQNAMFLELKNQGFKVEAQKQIRGYYKENFVGEYFADILVDQKVIILLKACSELQSAHQAQLLNYLKSTEIEVGLLLNFGNEPEFKRLIFTNNKKKNPSQSVKSVFQKTANSFFCNSD